MTPRNVQTADGLLIDVRRPDVRTEVIFGDDSWWHVVARVTGDPHAHIIGQRYFTRAEAERIRLMVDR